MEIGGCLRHVHNFLRYFPKLFKMENDIFPDKLLAN